MERSIVRAQSKRSVSGIGTQHGTSVGLCAAAGYHHPREDHMREPAARISSEQPVAVLGRPDLRIYDCTTYLEPPPPGNEDPSIAPRARARTRR
jgi:hypothetical protein